MPKKRPAARPRPVSSGPVEKGRLRIVGGTLRGRKIEYYGDRATRPMKDRTREAVFNILGHLTSTTAVVDLFAGTGALGIEALSRGAATAEFFESVPAALKTLAENLERLGVAERATLRQADAFRRAPRTGDPAIGPWLWFVSPPYRIVSVRRDDLYAMIRDFAHRAPAGSRFVFEVEENEDLAGLPFESAWDWRRYAPAWIGILDVDGIDDDASSNPGEDFASWFPASGGREPPAAPDATSDSASEA